VHDIFQKLIKNIIYLSRFLFVGNISFMSARNSKAYVLFKNR